jgi:hypothetical protein
MTHLPYTDDDLRAEAARLHARAARDADDRIRPAVERKWGAQAAPEAIDEACDELVSLLDGAADVSRWAVDLGASVLTRTTELAWGHGDNWHLAVQVAHRRGVGEELHQALVEAVRGAVRSVLDGRGIDTPEITQQAATEESAS